MSQTTTIRTKRHPADAYITGAELRAIRERLELSTEKFGVHFDLTGRRIRMLEAAPHEPVPYLVGRRAKELASQR